MAKKYRSLNYVSVIEDNVYLSWQQEVQWYNFQKIGLHEQLWIVIVHEGEKPAECIATIQRLHGERVRCYRNTQPKHYIAQYKASNKPWGIAQLLKERPELGKDALFSIDSDVWFKHSPDFTHILGAGDDFWYGSSCSSYLSAQHWQNGKAFSNKELYRMCGMVGVSLKTYKAATKQCIGAQLLFKDVDYTFFEAVALDSWRLFDALKEIQQNGKDNQIWVAEMMAFVFHMIRVKGLDGIRSDPSLDFAWADWNDENHKEYATCNIVHMAGQVAPNMFNKQAYTSSPPWESDLSHLDAPGASREYITLIQNYVSSIH